LDPSVPLWTDSGRKPPTPDGYHLSRTKLPQEEEEGYLTGSENTIDKSLLTDVQKLQRRKEQKRAVAELNKLQTRLEKRLSQSTEGVYSTNPIRPTYLSLLDW